jgi:hypothetical protein
VPTCELISQQNKKLPRQKDGAKGFIAMSALPRSETICNEDFASARQLELLALRSFQLADRVASGELQFLDAVDVVFDAAVASGLADKVGYDVVQAVLAAAFKEVRP